MNISHILQGSDEFVNGLVMNIVQGVLSSWIFVAESGGFVFISNNGRGGSSSTEKGAVEGTSSTVGGCVIIVITVVVKTATMTAAMRHVPKDTAFLS
jgi:hypothetical protein